MALSEFGRRVAENDNYGLDHGYGNVMWVMGPGVKGGHCGSWPGLRRLDADVPVTTDYRSVLAEVVSSRFGSSPRGVPGLHPRVRGGHGLTPGLRGQTRPRSRCDARRMTEPASAPAAPEDWERALCVVAHPDDLEFGAAAAVARWTGQGKHVVYCMVTSGEAGIDGMAPDECRRVREAEQVESARIVGVDRSTSSGCRTAILEYGVAAAPRHRRRGPAAPAGDRRHRQLPRHLGRRNLNQADHIAIGKATLDAVRDAGNRWVFPEQLTGGLEPWGGVRAGVGVRLARSPSTPWTSPTRSTRGSSPCAPTRPTSTAWAGRTSTRAEFLEGMSRAPASGWASRTRRRSRCSRSGPG